MHGSGQIPAHQVLQVRILQVKIGLLRRQRDVVPVLPLIDFPLNVPHSVHSSSLLNFSRVSKPFLEAFAIFLEAFF
jgi:hypothetical protein